jgi:O-antigen/teichoic acid export membrane protein
MDVAKNAIIRRQVVLSTAANTGTKLIMLGTWFFLTPFILHKLGAAGYGLWILVGSVVAYGSLLKFGIPGAVIKYVAEHQARNESEHASRLVATALCLYSVFGVAAIVFIMAIAPVFPGFFNVPPEDRTTAIWLVRLMGLGIGISIPCSLPTAVLWGLQRFDLSSRVTILSTILTATSTVAVLHFGGGLLGMVAVHIAVNLLMQVPTILFIRQAAPELRFGWRGAERSLIRRVISFGWPLFVIDVAERIQTKSDEIVISIFLPIAAVTPYAIARKLSEVLQILTDQFIKVLPPLASQLHAGNDRIRLQSVYITGTRVTLAILLSLGCVLVILAQPILFTWVGAAYTDYAHLVVILTLALLIETSQWPASTVLQGMARHKPLAAMICCSTLANLALSIFLVGRLGLTGVALGTLIPTMIVDFGLVWPYVLKVVGVSTTRVLKDALLPALLPAIPSATVLYLLEQAIEPTSLASIGPVAGIGFLVYVIGYLSWGASEIERQTWRSFAVGTVRFAETCLKRM